MFFHLSETLLVNLKFVGGFVSKPLTPDGFVLQEVYCCGKKAYLLYKHYPLPKFITKRKLSNWEQRIKQELSSYGLIPASSMVDFLSDWISEYEKAEFVGIANFIPEEEAVKNTDLLVVYRYRGKKLSLAKDSFKIVADKRAVDYLLPLGAFPDTILKAGVEDGDKERQLKTY